MLDRWMVTEVPFRSDGQRVDAPLLVHMFTTVAAATAFARDVEAQNPVTDWLDGCDVWIDCNVDRVVVQGNLKDGK
jgi:hypothetical protein